MKLLHFLLLPLAFAALITVAHAQEPSAYPDPDPDTTGSSVFDDMVFTFTMNRNDPAKPLNNLTFSACPVVMDINSTNFQTGISASVAYTLWNRIILSAEGRIAYFEDKYLHKLDEEAEYGVPFRGGFPAYHFEAVGRLVIFNNKKRKLYFLSTPKNQKYFGKGFKVYLPYKKQVSTTIRLGYLYDFSYLSANQAFSMKGFPKGDLSKTESTYSDRQYGSNVGASYIALGVSKVYIKDVDAKVDNMPRKTSFFRCSEFYADLLINPVITIRDMNVHTTYGAINRYELDELTQKTQKAGYRIGYNYRPYTKLAITAGVEYGRKPGVVLKGSQSYFLIKFGASLSTVFRPSFKKKKKEEDPALSQPENLIME